MSNNKASNGSLQQIPWYRRYKKPLIIGGAAGAAVIALAVALLILAPWRKSGSGPRGDGGAHNWVDRQVLTESTCTRQGLVRYTCRDCGETKVEKLPLAAHVPTGEYYHDEEEHWHICVNCGEVFDLGSHKWTESPTGMAAKTVAAGKLVCEFCGATGTKTETKVQADPVYPSRDYADTTTVGDGDYLFIPRLNGDNFTFWGTGGKKIAVDWFKGDLGNQPRLTLPIGSGTVTIKPTSYLKSKAELQRLLDAGRTEIRFTVGIKAIGGKGWGGHITVSSPYFSRVWEGMVEKGNLTVRFSLREFIERYDEISANGLFNFFFESDPWDVYEFFFTGVEIVTDHDFTTDWRKDIDSHWHVCTICGEKKDVAAHTLKDGKCSVCGPLSATLLTPVTGSGNYRAEANNGGVEHGVTYPTPYEGALAQFWADGNSAANIIVFSDNLDISAKEELEKIYAAGVTEVVWTLRFRINHVEGSGWVEWPMTVMVTAPWSGLSYSTWFDRNGPDGFGVPLTVKFPVKDLIDNFDKVANEGLFKVNTNAPQDSWSFDIMTPLTLTTDHDFSDIWEQTVTEHYRVCKICGAVEEATEEEHRFGENGYICDVCGVVGVNVFTPKADASNFSVSAGDAATANGKPYLDGYSYTEIPPVPNDTGIMLKALGFDFEGDALAALKALYERGYRELTGAVRFRITGGKWWGADIAVAAPWSGHEPYVSQMFDVETVYFKFALKDLIDNYGKAMSEGLLRLTFKDSVDNSIAVEVVKPLVATVSHEVAEEYTQSDLEHYHACSVCGEVMDTPERHTFTDAEKKHCSVCGDVHRYLFTPNASPNFTVKAYDGDRDVTDRSISSGWNGALAMLRVNCTEAASGARGIIFTANALGRTKEQLRALLDDGLREVTVTVRIRIGTGGTSAGWAMNLTLAAPWSGAYRNVNVSSNDNGNDKDGQTFTVAFALKDLVENFDTAANEGLLFVINTVPQNEIQIDFMSPFEITVAHSVSTGYYSDGNSHYHVCEICGERVDEERHSVTGVNCSVCGTVRKPVWTPAADFSNYTLTGGTPGAPFAFGAGRFSAGNLASITLTPADFPSKEELQQLYDAGYRGVSVGLRFRNTGGHLWGEAYAVTAPWCSVKAEITPTPGPQQVSGILRVAFPLKKLIEQRDSVLSGGLFTVAYKGAASDQWAVEIITPLETSPIEPSFADRTVTSGDPGVVVGDKYGIVAEDLPTNREVLYSADNKEWSAEQPTFATPGKHTVWWKVAAGDGFEAKSGQNTVTIKYYLNDLSDPGSVYGRYQIENPEGTFADALRQGGELIKSDDSGKYFQLKVDWYVPADSPAFYLKPGIPVENLQKLLDAGAKTVSIKVYVSPMQDVPWWGMTSDLSADWTTPSVTRINSDGGVTEVKLSLTDLIANYDRLTSGEVAFLKFNQKVVLNGPQGKVWFGGNDAHPAGNYSTVYWFNIYAPEITPEDTPAAVAASEDSGKASAPAPAKSAAASRATDASLPARIEEFFRRILAALARVFG